MKYKSLNSNDILSRIQHLVDKERGALLEILHLLIEIDRRKTHVERGFSSLFEFCVQVLGYSEGAAARRILTMRVLRDIPEADEAIRTGQASLSTLSLLQRFFTHEPEKLSPQEKRHFFQQILGKTKRESERYLISMSSRPEHFHERERIVSEDLTEIRFLASRQLMAKLRQIRNLTAHIHPNPTYGELIEWMADLSLKKLKPAPKSPQPQPTGTQTVRKSGSPANPTSPARQSIPAAMQREVWQRDQGKCQYEDSQTGKKCHSEFGIEFDHIVPVCHGGLNDLDNLQLTCKAHNLLRARQQIGELTMNQYVNR